MYFLRKLKQFQVDKKILVHFYHIIIQSVMYYNQVCNFGNSKKADMEWLDKVAWTAAKTVEAKTATWSLVYRCVAAKKLHRILSDTQHPMNHVLSFQASRHDSSQQLRCFRTRTSRFWDPFLPGSVRLHTSPLWFQFLLCHLDWVSAVCVCMLCCAMLCVCGWGGEYGCGQEGGGGGYDSMVEYAWVHHLWMHVNKLIYTDTKLSKYVTLF